MIGLSGDKIHYSWADIDQSVLSICSKLTRKPDLVVGIARGGLVPAVMFSHQLNVPMDTLTWSTRDFKSQRIDQLQALANSGSAVLFVDDLVDSGETFKQIMEAIALHCPSLQYQVATLIYNIGQDVYSPDYYHDIIDRRTDDRWIVFAYEREE